MVHHSRRPAGPACYRVPDTRLHASFFKADFIEVRGEHPMVFHLVVVYKGHFLPQSGKACMGSLGLVEYILDVVGDI